MINGALSTNRASCEEWYYARDTTVHSLDDVCRKSAARLFAELVRAFLRRAERGESEIVGHLLPLPSHQPRSSPPPPAPRRSRARRAAACPRRRRRSRSRPPRAPRGVRVLGVRHVVHVEVGIDPRRVERDVRRAGRHVRHDVPGDHRGALGEGVTRRGAGASGLGVNVGWGFGAGPTAGWSL